MLRITRDHIVYSLDKTQPPVAAIDPGAELLFETWDARTGTIRSEQDLLDAPHPSGPNPATGPVFVRGAEPGTRLAVEILGITLAARGYTGTRPGRGVLGHMISEYRTKLFDIRGRPRRLQRPASLPRAADGRRDRTAPAGEGVATLHPGAHGGNMDHNSVRVGARVHVPVFVPGALLCIGDVHASMGDGEISVTALEIPGEVRVRVDLVKGEGIRRPWIELPDAWITTGEGPGIAEAVRMAAEEMARFLMRRLGLSADEAYMLLSIRGTPGSRNARNPPCWPRRRG